MKHTTIKTLFAGILLATPLLMQGQNVAATVEKAVVKDASSAALERNIMRKTMFTWPTAVRQAYVDVTRESVIKRQYAEQKIPYINKSQMTVLKINNSVSQLDEAFGDAYRSFSLKRVNAAKVILEQNAKENAFYLPEIENAQNFLTGIEQAQQMELPASADLFAPYLANIPNKRLFSFLQEAIEKGDYNLMQRELREFYSIGMTNAKAAAKYAARHPHEPNLFVKRFFKAAEKTPLARFVPQIKALLEKDSFTAIDQAMYELSVETADKAYHNVMNLFAKDELIVEQANYYQNFLARFEDFLNEYGRLPSQSVASERPLFEEFIFVKQSIETNNFPPLSDYIQKAKSLAAPYEP